MYLLYTFLGLLGILLVLLFIAFINTIIIKDRSVTPELEPIDSKLADKYANEFSKMIKIKTLSYTKKQDNYQQFRKLQEEMKNLFPNVFKTLDQTVFKGESILFKWVGKSNDKPMVLMAHQDIVPASKADWKFDPFSGKVTDTDIHGRGTLDTKGTLYAFFKAIDELIESGFSPEQDIYISSSTDEEISGFGAELAVEELNKRGVKPYIVLDEGGAIVTGSLPSAGKPIALIGVIEKGYVNIKFTAKSKGGHSSTPPKNTPIARLSAFINDVETHFPLKSKMIPEVADIFKTAAPSMSGLYRFLFGNIWLFKPLLTVLLPKINSFGRALLSTTIAFTMSSGSKAANVIPSEAYVIANLRTHPIQDINSSFKVLEALAKKYDIEAVITESREASPISSTTNDMYQYLIETIKKNYPDVLVSPYIMLGGTDCRFFSEITDSAFRFSPVRMTNKELSKIHGKNEAIRKSALVEAVNFYKDFIYNHK
ncbi:MAG: M20/M25/M40 family metallo-hydrolase [Tenericutes bacterium]|nr:M20/M25/M40 family metallo-hydrolase [Mycoplasmatota bacterium]